MNKATKARTRKARERHSAQVTPTPAVYTCALCPGEITVVDSARGDLITVNIDGHAKAAHRICPPGNQPHTGPNTETRTATARDNDTMKETT